MIRFAVNVQCVVKIQMKILIQTSNKRAVYTWVEQKLVDFVNKIKRIDLVSLKLLYDDCNPFKMWKVSDKSLDKRRYDCRGMP